MASNYTTNYELPLWEPQDSFLRTEFNEAHQKIDAAIASKADAADVTALESEVDALARSAGNCRIVTGSYTGTGGYGEDQPNTLTFSFPPKLVVLAVGDAHSVLLSPCPQAAGYHEAYTRYGMLKLTWSGNSLSWYVDGFYDGSLYSNGGSAERQLNQTGTTYYYLALG